MIYLLVFPVAQQLAFVHAAPGFVNTNWGTEMPWYIRGPVRALQVLGKSPADCAEAMTRPAFLTDDELASMRLASGGPGGGSPGVVVMGEAGTAASRTAGHTPEARASVWATTVAVLSRAGITLA